MSAISEEDGKTESLEDASARKVSVFKSDNPLLDPSSPEPPNQLPSSTKPVVLANSTPHTAFKPTALALKLKKSDNISAGSPINISSSSTRKSSPTIPLNNSATSSSTSNSKFADEPKASKKQITLKSRYSYTIRITDAVKSGGAFTSFLLSVRLLLSVYFKLIILFIL